jgi:predicted acetyltransferase
MDLVRPGAEHLPSYLDALRQAWSPNTMRPEAAGEEIAAIEADPAGFLRSMDDRGGHRAEAVVLPDGSRARRLPSVRLWMWDGAFCGSIGLRWQPGSAELPEHVLGHIGYAVVPWKRRRGYATAALRAILPLAAEQGLPWVELTTVPDNLGSQRVIEACGGVLVERYTQPDGYGGGPGLRYRIGLAPAGPQRSRWSEDFA